METLTAHEFQLFEEIYPMRKKEIQVMVRVNPESKGPAFANFEIFADCFVGGSRNRERERKLSPGMIRYIAAVMRYSTEVKVRWILAEWNSVILRGREETINKLLKHDQVLDFKYNMRMSAVGIE